MQNRISSRELQRIYDRRIIISISIVIIIIIIIIIEENDVKYISQTPASQPVTPFPSRKKRSF